MDVFAGYTLCITDAIVHGSTLKIQDKFLLFLITLWFSLKQLFHKFYNS